MTHIAPLSSPPAGPVSAPPDDPVDALNGPPGAAPGDAHQDGSGAGAHPLPTFAGIDLHRAVQEFAYSSPGDRGDARILLAQFTPQTDGNRAADAGARLYNAQHVGSGAQAGQVAAPPPVVPGAPVDMQRMEAMNRTVQAFNVGRSPIPEADLRDTQRSFQAATEALRRGDYATAEHELTHLGFPLPPLSSNQPISNQAAITSHMLGVPAQGTRATGWSVNVQYGAHGNQAVNDLNGFAANTRMMNRMASTPGGVSNPPTEAQVMGHMRDFAQPAQGPRPGAQQVMQAASEITNGSIMHYSSAGAADPRYGANPNPHAFYRDRAGNVHEFDSLADARTAARAGNPPIAPRGQITTMGTRSPDEWSDITSQGTRAGRNIGDCESKLYLQTRLLTEAGFTSLGSVDVHPRGGGIGHMFGVFQAPDGTAWVTSNEEFRQVQGSGPNGAVTQADVDSTLRDMTADVYNVQPDRTGVRDTSRFNFSSAATVNQSGPNAAVDTIRRSTEMGMMRRSDTLIPPPPVQPPTGNSGQPGLTP